MAVSCTSLLADESTANQAAYTTASVSFTAGNPVILLVGAGTLSGNVGVASVTSAPSGVSFTKFYEWGLGGEAPTPRNIQCLIATPTSTVSGTVTITFASPNDIDECHWNFLEVTGDVDTTNPVVQVQGSTHNTFETALNTSGTNANSLVLSTFNNTTNGTLVVGIKGSNEAVTATGWTKVGETSGTIYGTHAVFKASNDTLPVISWTNSVHALFLAFEIGEITAGTTTCVKVPHRNVRSSGAGTSGTTHAFTRLRANKTYLVCCSNRHASDAGTVTPSATGLTFTQVNTVRVPAPLRTTAWTVTIGSSDFAGAITFTAGASQAVWGWQIFELGNADSVVQSATGQTSGSQASFTVTLAAFADAANRTIQLGTIISNTATVSVDSSPAGYGIVQNNAIASPTTMQMWLQTNDEADTSVVANFSPNANGSGMALELAPTAGEEPEEHSGTSSVSGGGTIQSAGQKTAATAVAVSGGGSVVASGTKSGQSVSQVSGGGTVQAIGIKRALGTSGISGGGLFAALGRTARFGSSVVSGGGSVTTVGVPSGLRNLVIDAGRLRAKWETRDIETKWAAGLIESN